MTAPTVPVTCAASDQNGPAVAGALYAARLNSTEIYQGFVVPEIVRGTADANGICVLHLWPNALGVAGSLYEITATNPDTGKKFLKATAAVPNGPCNLHQILVQEPYPTVDASQQALIDLQAAQAEIEADRVQTGQDRNQTGLDRSAAGDSASAALVSKNAAGQSAATALDASSYLNTYIDQVVANVTFPLDLGLIADPVIYNTFDLGIL